MANKLIKVTDEDFQDKDHFITVQCQAYRIGLGELIV